MVVTMETAAGVADVSGGWGIDGCDCGRMAITGATAWGVDIGDGIPADVRKIWGTMSRVIPTWTVGCGGIHGDNWFCGNGVVGEGLGATQNGDIGAGG